jgi:hypothetical protein
VGGDNAPDLFVVRPGNGSAMSGQQLAPAGVQADLSGQGWIERVPENLRPLLGQRSKTYMYARSPAHPPPRRAHKRSPGGDQMVHEGKQKESEQASPPARRT